MSSERLPDPILITRPEPLRRLVEELAREPVVAVDTESNSLYAYQEQVCLIQFSTPEKDFLVDPLAIQDLSPLGPIFENPEIEKVFHAAEYDLMCMDRDFGFRFNNLFDTMVAARILGRDAIGLGSMLESEFGVQLEKRYQRADWGKRPLPQPMLSYARLDTHYLIPLRDRLDVDLREAGLRTLAEEDFVRQTNHVDGSALIQQDDQAGCWRVKGAYDLEPQQAAVLMELCHYRDRVAQEMDRPLFKVMNDRTLVAIAQDTPNNLRDLGHLPGMSKRQVQRHGDALLAAVRRGLQSDPLHPPRSSRPSDDYLERLDKLRQWRKERARKMGVKSDVVLPRDLMMNLAGDNPKSMDRLSQVLSETPWRVEHFGSQILEVLNGS